MKILSIALFIIFILNGCSSSEFIEEIPFQHRDATRGVDESNKLISTPTIVISTSSYTQEVTNLFLKTDCATLEKFIPTDLKGTIIYAVERKLGPLADLTYFDPTTQTFENLPDTKTALSGYTSPSGDKLFYEHIENGIRSLHLYRFVERDEDWGWHADWSSPNGWLDNDRFSIKSKSSKESIWLINTSSGKVEKINPVLSDLYQFKVPETANNPIRWISTYDSKATRIVYLTNQANKVSLIMRDLPGMKALWEFQKWAVVLTKPTWSFNGKYLAAGALGDAVDQYNRIELYIVDREGHVRWVFDRKEHTDMKGPLGMLLDWAPDNQKLGVTILAENSPLPLMIVDNHSGQITNLCLNDLGMNIAKTIWSPYSDSLIIETFGNSYLVDLVSNTIVLIEDEVSIYPIGWLILN